METSRQHLVEVLRRTGMLDLADEVEETFPDPVDVETMERFCNEHGLSRQTLVDRMGGSP